MELFERPGGEQKPGKKKSTPKMTNFHFADDSAIFLNSALF